MLLYLLFRSFSTCTFPYFLLRDACCGNFLLFFPPWSVSWTVKKGREVFAGYPGVGGSRGGVSPAVQHALTLLADTLESLHARVSRLEAIIARTQGGSTSNLTLLYSDRERWGEIRRFRLLFLIIKPMVLMQRYSCSYSHGFSASGF